jgi:hypothetical protein
VFDGSKIPASLSINIDRSVSRVLVYRLGSLSHTVVALPALLLVARAFPNAERMMLTNWPVSSKAAGSEQILANSGLIQRYVSYPGSLRNQFAIFRLTTEMPVQEWQLRRNRSRLLGIASRDAFREISLANYHA